MIGYLEGKALHLESDHVTLLTNGVGYDVLVSSAHLSEINFEEQVSIWIYTHVREDIIQLFGFRTVIERQFFTSLLKVNGVGPKSAMNILGAQPLKELISKIEGEDVRGLSQLPKVGKKTAEQIILTLKGKLVWAEPKNSGSHAELPGRKDVVSTLVNLGFRVQEVEKVVDAMDSSLSFEDSVRRGLAMLTSQF